VAKRLTQRQETFVVSYFQTGNATQSAITAGYSPKGVERTASKMLRNAKISTRLQELNDTRNSPKIMGVNRRKERLADIAEENNEGKFGYQRTPNIQAIDTLNKMDKVYEADGGVTIDNRTINIYVNSDKAKELTQRLIGGERTEL